MSEAVQQLTQLGFSQYEAQAYVSLLQHSPLNGYELAKASGIPRPNVYAVLKKLEEKGAVVRLDTPEGIRYAPVASSELVHQLRNNFQTSLEAAACALNEITVQTEQESIWNMHGYAALLEHARAFIEITRRQLLIAVWPQEAKALAGNVLQARERGVEVTTLCLAGCQRLCGSCQGHVYRYPVTSAQQARWLVMVPDQIEVLAGEIQSADEALAVRTRQKLLVELATWYIRHSIALAAILEDIGERVESTLSPETRAILANVGPEGVEGGWLGHMRQLLKMD